MTNLGPDPLARIPGDSKKSHAAFRDYAMLGTGRSLDALHLRYVNAESMGGQRPPTLKRNTLGSWSHRNNWVARAAAYDADLQQQARIAQIEAVREMAVRQAELGRKFQRMSGDLADQAERYIQIMRVATVETVNERGEIIRVVKTNLTPQEMASLLRALAGLAKVGMDMERLARGEATANVDVFQRVRELADKMGLSDSEKQAAVAAAERHVRGE